MLGPWRGPQPPLRLAYGLELFPRPPFIERLCCEPRTLARALTVGLGTMVVSYLAGSLIF